MAKLYVPIVSNKNELFEVKTVFDEDLSVNGFYYHSDCENVDPLLKKLKDAFSDDIKARIKIRKGDEKFKSFDSSTQSVYLGIFVSLFSYLKKREFSKKYSTITITGNFSVCNKKIKLEAVSEIQNKFEAAKNNASFFPNEKHLFIYVSDEEENPVQEGWHKNLFVEALSSKEKIECVFAEIFESAALQKKAIFSFLDSRYKNEYVETPSFIEWKKELIGGECAGFIIQGKSNSGKTIAATNLCKYLLVTNFCKKLIWITINDNKRFWNKITESTVNPINFDKTQIIKNEFLEQFCELDEFLASKKEVCLIIDNIEGDFVDEILTFIKGNYKEPIEQGFLKIILTTWYKSKDKELSQSLRLSEKNAEKLEITRNEFNYIVFSVLETFQNKSVYFESPVELQNKLLNLLYKQCFNEKVIYPGYVALALAPLRDIELAELLERYEQEDIKNLSSKKRILKIDFEVLDPVSQLVFFTFLGIHNYWGEVNAEEICKTLNTKIFNSSNVGNSFISERNVADSIKKLVKKDFLQKNEKNAYFIKKDVVEYCIFSSPKKGEIEEKFTAVRNVLIPDDVKIEFTIQYNLFDEFKSLIKDFSDRKKINDFFIYCIEKDKGLNYLKVLVEKGIDPNYKDKDEHTAIDTLWSQKPDMKVLDYLLEKGFKPRNKFPCHDKRGNHYYISPLMIASDKCYVPLVKRILENHLFDDIDEYEFQGYTNLQLYTAIGTSLEAVRLLIEAGADISLKTKSGLNLLSLAVFNDEHPEILEYLVQNKLYGNVSEKDDKGKTALDYALQIKNKKAIAILTPLFK